MILVCNVRLRLHLWIVLHLFVHRSRYLSRRIVLVLLGILLDLSHRSLPHMLCIRLDLDRSLRLFVHRSRCLSRRIVLVLLGILLDLSHRNRLLE